MSGAINIVVTKVTGPISYLDFVNGTQVDEPGSMELVDTDSGYAFAIPLHLEQYAAFFDAVSQITLPAGEAAHAEDLKDQHREEAVVPAPERRGVSKGTGATPVSAIVHIDSDGPGSTEGTEEFQKWGGPI